MKFNVNIYQGDITQRPVDAIVNAANPSLMGGAGVDGAIHRAAGPMLRESCKSLPEVRLAVRCPVGQARSTPGFNLPATYVIHTAGPIYPTGRDVIFAGERKVSFAEADLLLAQSVRSCLEEAERLMVGTIAFPAISCGFYGCVPTRFAKIIREILEEREWCLKSVEVVLFTRADHEDFMMIWDGEELGLDLD